MCNNMQESPSEREKKDGKKFRILIFNNIFLSLKDIVAKLNYEDQKNWKFFFICDYFALWHFIENSTEARMYFSENSASNVTAYKRLIYKDSIVRK